MHMVLFGDMVCSPGHAMRAEVHAPRWGSAGHWDSMQRGATSRQSLLTFGDQRANQAGEDVVTQESFVSIGWRLIPYWLNNWEQQWGAECSSMVFELPHFALELLVVLPCVQVSGGEAGGMGQVRRS